MASATSAIFSRLLIEAEIVMVKSDLEDWSRRKHGGAMCEVDLTVSPKQNSQDEPRAEMHAPAASYTLY